MKKVAIVTGSRAEYGLLKGLIFELKEDIEISLSLIVTGTHLSESHGLTKDEILRDGLIISKEVDMIPSGDLDTDIGQALGNGVIGFIDALSDLNIDLMVILGDRYEIFASVLAGFFLKIPIAHIHGGETTLGSLDEGIRHSISKMSFFHFPATEVYRKRLIQMGENPNNIFNVGSLGVDSISRIDLIPQHSLEKQLKFKFKKKNLLVVFHSETLGKNSETLFSELLKALEEQKEKGIIFTFTNNDSDSRIINHKILEFIKLNKNAIAFQNLGQQRFLSVLNIVDGIVGNSSSGIIEAPSLKKGAINIGSRQTGRVKSSNIIDSEPDSLSILRAIKKLYSKEFQSRLGNTRNLYGKPGAAKKIANIIRELEIPFMPTKKFFDLG